MNVLIIKNFENYFSIRNYFSFKEVEIKVKWGENNKRNKGKALTPHKVVFEKEGEEFQVTITKMNEII